MMRLEAGGTIKPLWRLSHEELMIHRYLRAALWAVMCFVLCADARSALAGENPFIGEVETFAFGFCPVGWTTLNGELLLISQNQALFALLGTTYGVME
jgi:hypothetical protein